MDELERKKSIILRVQGEGIYGFLRAVIARPRTTLATQARLPIEQSADTMGIVCHN